MNGKAESFLLAVRDGEDGGPGADPLAINQISRNRQAFVPSRYAWASEETLTARNIQGDRNVQGKDDSGEELAH
jgi:hypothetical protein